MLFAQIMQLGVKMYIFWILLRGGLGVIFNLHQHILQKCLFRGKFGGLITQNSHLVGVFPGEGKL